MRLLFRRIDDEALPRILRWRRLPEVTRYMYTDVPDDLAAHRAWFARIGADSTRRDWEIVVDGEPVGLVSITGIDRQHRRCSWAYYLGEVSARGRGIGKAVELSVLRYVFEDLGLHKLCCEVFADNEKVIQLHERYGSRVEGRRRDHVCKDGVMRDIVEMGILAAEWRAEIAPRYPDVALATIE